MEYANEHEFRGFIDMIEWITIHPWITTAGGLSLLTLAFLVAGILDNRDWEK